MTSKILSISVPEQMIRFLDDHPHLSPSKLLQSKITEIMERERFNPELQHTRKELDSAVKMYGKLQKHLQEATEFITLKGLWDEFVKTVENET